MKTLTLITETWDLTIDGSGNISVTDDPLSLAQDAASAIRLFSGELWYDTSQGVPYFQEIYGKFPVPLSLMRALFIKAALTVPEVVSANCFFTSISQRAITGQVQITDSNSNSAAVNF